MALPFILGAAALAAAGYGAKKSYDGYQDQSLADDINKDTESLRQAAQSAYDEYYESANQNLASWDDLKLKIITDFKEFIKLSNHLLEKIKRSHNSKNLTIHIPYCHLNAIKRLELSPIIYLSQVMGGAMAAYTTYTTTATIATSMSAVPISGVAATHATLTAIGGGLGMAGGTAILSGVVAAPALATIGWMYASHAEKALDNARENRSKSNQDIEKMEYHSKKLKEIIEYTNKIQNHTYHLYKIFTEYFNELKSINAFIEADGNIQEKEEQTIKTIKNGMMLADILTNIIITPLFKLKTDNTDHAVVDVNQTVELAKDEHGMPILNKEEIDDVVDDLDSGAASA